MTKKFLPSLLLVIWLAVLNAASGCSPSVTPELPTVSSPATFTPLAEVLPTEIITPVASPEEGQPTQPAAQTPVEELPPSLPLPAYIFTATLNYAGHTLAVEERIEYSNRSSQTLDALQLVVPPHDFLNVFTFESIAWSGGQQAAGWQWDGSQVAVPLAQPLPPGGTAVLQIHYRLALPAPQPSAEVRPIPFGYTTRQTNLVDWYPFVPPYIDGQGWLAHPAGYFGEHLAYEIADFDVRLRLEDEGTYAQAGTPLTIAASAPGELREGWYHFKHPAARNFVWSVSEQYQVFTTTVGGVTVASYAFPYHTVAGQAVLKTTAEALALYNEMFEPYPRAYISAVEADFLDGMEYDGLYFLSIGFYNLYQDTPGEYLVAIAAHETAHQWWYAMVGNDQALEPWLDEALCTYSERIFYERLYPEAVDWWQAYRVEYYNPRGMIDRTIYEPGGYLDYRDSVYLNGAVFLHDLRQEIGDEAFFAFLKGYAREMAGKIATGNDFFRILDQYAPPAGISGLQEKYFHSP